MKINRLDAHDRLEHFKEQEFDIGKTCQNIIDSRPFGEHAFYIFAHKREIGLDERIAIFNADLMNSPRQFKSLEQVPSARLIWQPRLTKPKAQSNSMLFKAYPGKDTLKVIWMIPAPELWDQYAKGNVTENETVSESIHLFRTDKARLEAKEEDDLPDAKIDAIYREISWHAKGKKL